MENQGITPVQVIQELMAMLTTRKEATEKIAAKPGAGELSTPLQAYGAQSDKYISELQGELSEFGDAVMADVDRNNAYHSYWKQALENEETASAKELEQRFMQMEDTLEKIYHEYTDSATGLPESLTELLKKQADGIQHIVK